MKNLLERIKIAWNKFDAMHRERASGWQEQELKELQNIFALLVCGGIIGLPNSPVHLQVELMPDMEAELAIMFERMETAHDPLAELFSVFDIG
jgi:hypothetical protein